jgi:hypothetical protein
MKEGFYPFKKEEKFQIKEDERYHSASGGMCRLTG